MPTPGPHNKNPRHKIFAKGWVAQNDIFDRYLDGCAKIFQGLGPKRPESCDGNWVYEEFTRLAETMLAQSSLNYIKTAKLPQTSFKYIET